MNYHSSNKKKNDNSLIKFGLFVLFVTIISSLFLYPFTGFIKYTGAKGKSFIYSLPIFSVLHNGATLYSDNQNLRAEIETLKAEVSDKDLLEQKISELGVIGSIPKDSILAEVLSTPGSSIYDVLVLDASSKNGVKYGDPIFSGGVEIGKITAVYGNVSEATLFTSPGQKVQGVLHPEGFDIDITGIGGGLFESMVPKGSPVNVGDIVEDSLNKEVLGTVREVNGQENDAFKRIIITAPVNPYELKWISIIIK
ncbi:MAG: rod shape-determining protein MreC [bacterium]